MSTTTFPQEFPFEYTSNLSNQMLILVSESLGESGSGTGSANLYYCLYSAETWRDFGQYVKQYFGKDSCLDVYYW